MGHRPRHSLGLLIVAAGFFLSWLSSEISAQAPTPTTNNLGSDTQALLEFHRYLIGRIPTDWNVNNISMVCSWQGVTCVNNRVSQLALNIDDVIQFNGTSVDMLLRLDALNSLRFPTCSSDFEYPPELFQLPSLVSFTSRGGRFRTFPTTFSPALQIFAGIAGNFSAPIPNTFNWANMVEFQMPKSLLRCPLPQGLIDRARQTPTEPWICSLVDNYLWIEDGRICGQIKPSEFSCKFWPQRPATVQVDPPASTALTTSFGQWHVEFKEISILLFKKSAAGAVQRNSYVSATIFPPQPGRIITPSSLDAIPISSYRWVNTSYLQIDLEFRSRTNQVMAGIIQIDFAPRQGNIKFGNDILSFSTQLTNYNISAEDNSFYPWRLTSIYLFKLQHSQPGAAIPLCNATLWCNSSFATDFSSNANLFEGITNEIRTPDATFGLAISTKAAINDLPLKPGFDIIFWNLGDATDVTETANKTGPSSVPRANTIEDQAVAYTFHVEVDVPHPIVGVLSIPALEVFERSASAPIAVPAMSVEAAGSSNVGTIVGITIAVVVVLAALAGALLLRRKMSHDRAARSAAVVAAVELDEEQRSQRRRDRGRLVYMQQLGAGSSGSVMLAMYQGAFVAVKRLVDTNAKSTQQKNNRRDDLRSLIWEAETMASVKNNKNVVKLIEIIEEESDKTTGATGLAIVMEFCPRGSLANHIKKQQQLTDYDMFKYAYGISNGMAALTLAGVVHCDLACRNVLLSEHLHAKVSDFGLSTRASGGSKAFTSDTDDLGPIKWQAPEVVASGEYSEKSDVWAYGCCLIEIVTGQAPFHNFKGSILDLRTKIQTQSYSPLQHLEETSGREHRDKIPEWMAGVLRSCFHAIPTSRPTFREIRYTLAKSAREWKNRFEDEEDEIESMLSAPGTYSSNYDASNGADAAPIVDSISPTSKTLVLSRPALSTTAAKVDLQNIERLSKLGSGSFGSVFLGQSQGVYVALKVLDAAASKEDEVKREADVMLSIKPHRNIVQIYGLISHQEQLSIVMEFAPGGSLESFVATQMQQPGQKISEAQLFRWSVGIARGMASLCASGVIHRDLAMRNILLDSSLEPKVSDFGLARTVLDPNQEAHTKTDIGPIRWFAPECYDMKYSEKSDVWAFGCTLVEMMTGQIPFFGIKLLDVVEAVRERMQSPLAYMHPDAAKAAPKWLLSITAKCCMGAATERPTFKDIVSFLEEAGTQIAEVQQVEAEIQKRRNRRADTLRARKP